jgi:hypothetical protein
MSRLGPFLLAVATLFLTALSVACGSGGSGSQQLQSLTISPGTASGQVQFSAMGTYSGSHQSTAVNALWWTVPPWTALPASTIPVAQFINVSTSGLAQCYPLAPTGNYRVWVVAPVDPMVPLSQVTMTTKQLVATAQLACP